MFTLLLGKTIQFDFRIFFRWVMRKTTTRWWFQIFFIFTPIWGNDPIWWPYFSNGLKPPPRLVFVYNVLGWCLGVLGGWGWLGIHRWQFEPFIFILGLWKKTRWLFSAWVMKLLYQITPILWAIQRMPTKSSNRTIIKLPDYQVTIHNPWMMIL